MALDSSQYSVIFSTKYCMIKSIFTPKKLPTHFPTELKQFEKFHQKSDICFPKAKRVYKKTSLTVKSNNSGFLSYFRLELRNFETQFQACDTWPSVI